MGDDGKDLLSTVLVDSSGGLGKLLKRIRLQSGEVSNSPTYCPASVGHVVNENRNLVLDITDEDHAANNVGTRSLLVDESKSRVETVSNRCGTLGTTGIGRYNDAVLNVQVLADPSQDGGFCVKVIHRDVEEPLDLRGVKIHGDDMVLSRVLERPMGLRVKVRNEHTQPETWSILAMSLALIGARDLSFLS